MTAQQLYEALQRAGIITTPWRWEILGPEDRLPFEIAAADLNAKQKEAA